MSVIVENRCQPAVNSVGVTLILIGLQIAWAMTGIALAGGLIDVAFDWTTGYDTLTIGISGLYGISLLVAGVMFIRWQRTATRNLLSFGAAKLDPGVGLSSWGWFIPVLSLFIPYLSLRQIALRSAPEGERPSTSLVGWWWAGWVVANVSGWAVSAYYRLADTARGWITATTLDVASSTLLIVTGLLAIRMLRQLTRQQKIRCTLHRGGLP